MRYFWCWVFPPLGMLTCGRPGLAVVAFIMCVTVVGYLPAAIWSYFVAAEYYAEKRNEKLVRAMRGNSNRSPSRRREEHDEHEETTDSDNPFRF